ncbi:Uncharacterised protein [Serratia marcescens]|uniref:hypothetical protein n=1 Tax=Serratia marcescens TaxID=615 RepID=UPI000744E52D|nr:hypothetical protein [Serratia marcescens]CUZ15411.1 Uncharacterised protein [Serratia marcescens]CVD94746.1 Uncharacterised protein [Serratia marcescens]
MTTIKRFTPDYKMHAVRFEAFAREAEHGELVQFDDHQQVVSAVEAERDALAVENATLKSAITGKAYIDFVTSNGWNPGMKTINGKFAGFMDAEIDFGCMAYDHAKKLIDAVETPATDAALAAIQAQAIEDAVKKVLSVDTIASTAVISHLLRTYATELREAK